MSDQPQREMTLPELVETLPHTHRAYQEYNMLVDELVQLRSAYENACLAKQHHFKALQAEQEKYREAMLKWSEESLRANELNKELESEREKLTKAVALIDSIKNNIGFGGRENMIAAMDKIVKFQTEIHKSKPESNSEGE